MSNSILLPYGAVLDSTSKDFDVIPCPSQLLSLLPEQGKQVTEAEVSNEKQVDLLYPYDSRTASHAYWNLHHDYGEEFAVKWREAMGFEKYDIYRLDDWMQQNASWWEGKLFQHSHPRIWGKWMFARLQLLAHHKGFFTNRKTRLLQYLRQKPEVLEPLLDEFPNEAPLREEKEIFFQALEDILLRGDDFSKNVENILSLSIKREVVDGIGEYENLVDIKVVFRWAHQTYVGNYKGTLEISVYTATDEDLWEIWEEESKFLLPKIVQISSGGGIEYDASHEYWDGYGI